MKSICIRSFSGPCFPTFGLSTERYSISLCIQLESGKIRTRKTPHTDTLRLHSKFGKIRSRKTSNTETYHAVAKFILSVASGKTLTIDGISLSAKNGKISRTLSYFISSAGYQNPQQMRVRII